MASGEALFNPSLPEFHADPYPFYHRLRAVAPVYQTPMGFWVLTRYDDVVTVLRDPRFGRDGFEQMLAAVYADDRAESSRLPRSMLFRDPPDHTRLRALVSKAFTPRVIERMVEHIQDIVNRLLGRVRDAKGMDVITDLAYPLPVTVICEMVGVPTGDEGVIRRWSSDVAPEPRRDRHAIRHRGRRAWPGGPSRAGRLLSPSSPRAAQASSGRSPEPADRRRGSRRHAERRGAARHLRPALHRRP